LRFDGYMICSDFDGTLANEKSEISPENADAIRYFQNNGGIFTLASGRTPDFVRDLAPSFIPNGPLICLNGTRVCDPVTDKVLMQSFLPPEALDIIRMLYENGNLTSIQPIIEADSERLYLHKSEHSLDDIIESIGNNRMHKVLFIFNDADAALDCRIRLNRDFGEKMQFCRSWAYSVEMFSKFAGKGECLSDVRKFIERPIHTVIGIGDYENDISLVKCADIGYAVENAIDEVKAIADRIAPPNTQNAIAEIINSL
jgi:Cof subfamily protein (haloacid dehalogenase superfamily)